MLGDEAMAHVLGSASGEAMRHTPPHLPLVRQATLGTDKHVEQ